MDGITRIADSLSADLKRRLPGQRKIQREKVALLVATMVDVRSANRMDLAAGLPRAADRTDRRYQGITRLLGTPLVMSGTLLEPVAREVLSTIAAIPTLEYSQRWGSEPMVSDFKSRGFGIEDTQIRYTDRLDRLILVMALALDWAVSTGQWDALHHATPGE